MLSKILSTSAKRGTTSRKSQSGLISVPVRNYEKMTTEQYLMNTRQAFMNSQMQRAKLRPLLEASKQS